MSYQTISNHQSPVAVTVTPANGKNLLGIASDNKGGFWTGGMSLNSNNTPGIVYHHATAGTTSFTLPYTPSHPASADAPSPSASEIMLHNDQLYISDDNYGTIYQYDTKTSPPQATVLVDIPLIGTLKSQSAGMTIINDNTLWFLEIHGCWLCAKDLTSGAGLQKYDLAAAVGITPRLTDTTPPLTPGQTLITTLDAAGKHVLWLTMFSNQSPSDSWLIRVNAENPTEIKTWDMKGARSLALFQDRLYIGAKKSVFTKSVKNDEEPKFFVAVPETASISYMTTDAAGYLWLSDYRSKGKVYEISPEASVVAAYQLIAPPSGGEPANPAHIIWTPSESNPTQDNLLVVDSAENARIIVLTPPDAIDKSGKSSLSVSATPPNKSASLNSKLETEVLVKKGSTTIESVVQFFLEQSANKLITATTPPDLAEGAVLIPASGQKIILNTGSHPGEIKLNAKVRGGGDFKLIFTGNIEPAVSSLSFSPMKTQVARATEQFPKESGLLVVTVNPASKGTHVKLTLTNAQFDAAGDTLDLVTDDHGKITVPHIVAGNKAGDMIITAEAGGKKTAVTWTIVAKPTVLEIEDKATFRKAHLNRTFDIMKMKVKGYSIDNDTNSPLVPVPDVTLKIQLKKTIPPVAHFVSLKDGKTIDIAITDTDTTGNTTLAKAGCSIELDDDTAGAIDFTIDAVHSLHGPASIITKEFRIKLS